jgi:WD40 repeat protein
MCFKFSQKILRIFIVLFLLSTIWGCKQKLKVENDSLEKNNLYFFWTIDWHPDMDQLIAGGMQDTLRLFSSSNFQLLKNYPHKGTITKAKWHPNQNKLAISVQDGKSISSLLNLEDDQSIKLESISAEGARAIGWNHSGDLLAVGDNEGYITLFDESGIFLKSINTNQKGIMGLDWHPSENLIVIVGEKITLYDYESDNLRHINDRNEEIEVLMLCVAWHPAGKIFVTGDYGDFQYQYPPLLQYWTYDGERIISIEESKAEYRNLKWSSDGELLATASEKIRLWNVDGDLVGEKATQNLLWGIDWNKEDNTIVTTDEGGSIIFWDRNLNISNEIKH